jgi:hypothetical protein
MVLSEVISTGYLIRMDGKDINLLTHPLTTFSPIEQGKHRACSAQLLSGCFGYNYGWTPSTSTYASPKCLAAARG